MVSHNPCQSAWALVTCWYYTSDGLFVVKVGNLTGNGINWQPRDRNFIDRSEISKRAKQNLMIKEGDILLTSSAHSVIYIAKKVDIVHKIPKWVGGNASIVGEVMLLRPDKQKIDPYALLAYPLSWPKSRDWSGDKRLIYTPTICWISPFPIRQLFEGDQDFIRPQKIWPWCRCCKNAVTGSTSTPSK